RSSGLTIERGKGLGGRVLETGRPLRVERYGEDARISRDYEAVTREDGIVAAMAVPIRLGDRTEGLLYVQNRTARAFTARDEAALVRLSDHVARAIEKARLTEELTAREARLETLFEVSHEISRLQPVESLLQRLAEACGRLLGSDSVGFRLLEGDEMVVAGT